MSVDVLSSSWTNPFPGHAIIGQETTHRFRAEMTAETDEQLMEAVAGGDRAAFDRLARRHLKRIVALAARVSGNDSDAQEIAQETLTRVWITAPRWQPSAKFTTWLYRVVVNLCLDRKRRVTPAPLETAGDPADPAASAFDRVDQSQTARHVADALQSLPARQRAAVVLCYYEEHSNSRAAEILCVSVSALEALLVRGRRSLAQRLGRLREDRQA